MNDPEPGTLLRVERDGAIAHLVLDRLPKTDTPPELDARAQVMSSLAEALLKVLDFKVVADLGAGEGTLAQLLAQRAESVIAVDLSPKMVEFGQALARTHGLNHLEYRLGDIEEPPIDDATLDLAVLSQALHHAEHPQRALDSAFRILKPGGRLIVLDLLQHQFEEARELYADRWLGFAESELAAMMERAGFSRIETVVADREESPPYFRTLLGIGVRG
jgi:ArsR family transcriptional regulator